MEQSCLLLFPPNMWMDYLNKIENIVEECHIGSHHTGCIGYANYITLLAPTRSRLMVLFDICKTYAYVHVNGDKSRYLIIRDRSCKPDNIMFFNDTAFIV